MALASTERAIRIVFRSNRTLAKSQELLASRTGFDFTGPARNLDMTKLVVLSKEREKKSVQGQESLVLGLKKLLEAAERGELKGVCYATVNTGDILSFGVLHTPNCGAHELVGVSQMLTYRLTQAAAE